MNIEIMRSDFERRFPVPDGIYYRVECKGYDYLSPMYEESASQYQARWEAWQAAKEQAALGHPWLCRVIDDADGTKFGSGFLAQRLIDALLAAEPEVKP